MQPRSVVSFDPSSFSRIREQLRSRSAVARSIDADPGYATPVPEEIGFQLTNRCDLRCRHCFQWNETGFHRLLPGARRNDDLDINVVEKVLEDTRSARSKVFLWGGEPLVYRHWDRLIDRLTDDPRWTVLCTNGIGLPRRIDSLVRISPTLVVLMSLDGLEEENDAIRGAGTYRKILESIDLLLDLKRRGIFRGEVSVSSVISTPMVPKLYEFVEFFEARGVNSVYLVFPWYIPATSATRMDHYVEDRLAWLPGSDAAARGRPASWHSYNYHIDPESVPALRAQMERISARLWRIRLRFQPALEPEEILDFISGSERPAQNRTRCLSVATRLSVLPDGSATSCKLFPEMAVGDLSRQTVAEVWHGETARRTRATLACGLTPVCSKCVQLYLHGA